MGTLRDLPLEIIIEILSLLGPLSLKPRTEELSTRYAALLLTARVNEAFYVASRGLLWNYLWFGERESGRLWLKEVDRIDVCRVEIEAEREREEGGLEEAVDGMDLSGEGEIQGGTANGTNGEATKRTQVESASTPSPRRSAGRACLRSGEIPVTKYLCIIGAGPPLQDQVLGQAAKEIINRVEGSVMTLILKNIFGLDSMVFNSPALKNVNYLDLNTRFTFDDEFKRTISKATTTPCLFPSLTTLIVSQPIPSHLFSALLTAPPFRRNPNLVFDPASADVANYTSLSKLAPSSTIQELELNLMGFMSDQIADIGSSLALAASSVRVLRIVSILPLDEGFLSALGGFGEVKILSVSTIGIKLSEFVGRFSERMRLLAFMVVRMDQLDEGPIVPPRNVEAGEEEEEIDANPDSEIIKELKKCLHDPRLSDLRTWLIAEGVPPFTNAARPPPAPLAPGVAQRRLERQREEAQLDRVHPHHAAQGGDEDRYFDEEEELEEDDWWKLRFARGLEGFLGMCRERGIVLHLDSV